MSQTQGQSQGSGSSPLGNGQPGTATAQESGARAPLGLWDAVSIIVGIVVGAGIYQTAPFILKNVRDPLVALEVWALGGVLSIIGGLCYAELATTYPRTGGDYVYLGRAYGPWAGFLFGWVQLTVILTGSIGMMAFVFSDYALRFCKEAFEMELNPDQARVWGFAFAALSVLLLTIMNVLGVVLGKLVQNVLTVAKVLGLGTLIVVGFTYPVPGAWDQTSLPPAELRKLAFPSFEASLGVALVLILYTYGGWNDAAFVAAEVRDGKRNISRALILGIVMVTVLYLLVNAAYITCLGFHGAQASRQIAADVLNRAVGARAASLMCVLVMTSALGAVNGLIFTGARVYSILGRDHSVLSWMGSWDRRHATPVPALITQGVITLLLIFLVGTEWGREAVINNGLELVRLKSVSWEGAGGFDTLLTCTAPVFWLFFLMTGLSVFILRERDRGLERPFKVPLYPELPLIFCATCGYMLYSSIGYAVGRGWAGGVLLLGVLPLLVGLPLYRLTHWLDRSGAEQAGRTLDAPPPGQIG